MPNKNYLRGYNFEYRVKKKLEKLGFWISRQGRSKFPDFVAVSRDFVFFAECKNHKYIPKEAFRQMSDDEIFKSYHMINNFGKPFYLIYNENKRIKVIAMGGKGVFEGLKLEEKLNERKKKI